MPVRALPLLVYHGARARFLYFECLQLLLRKQVAVLRKEWGLPDKFEVRACVCPWSVAAHVYRLCPQVICRDVWALHLSLLPRPPVSEEDMHVEGRGVEEDEKSEDGDYKSDSIKDSSPPPADSLLAGLMREASESSERSADEGAGEGGSGRYRAARRTRNRYEKPVGNVAVLMVACWTLRVPVMYADIIR